MSKIIDITGKSFGRLFIVSRAPDYIQSTGYIRACWHCVCSCGNAVIVNGTDLRTGRTLSCGCLQKERTIISNTKHGLSGSKVESVWHHITNRCNNPKNKRFSVYGGRGIKICECIPDFQTFFNYVSTLPHYNEDGYSIDRIDNDGNYCLCNNNLRWATTITQARNKSHPPSNNKSGYTGVYKTKSGNWNSYIRVNGKLINLGTYKTIDNAIIARANAELFYWS